MNRRGFFGSVSAALGAAACAAIAPIASVSSAAWVELGRWRDYGNLQDVFLRTTPSADWKPHSYRVIVMTKDRRKSETIMRDRWVENISPGAFICLHTMRAGDTFVGAHIYPVSSSDCYARAPAIEFDPNDGQVQSTSA